MSAEGAAIAVAAAKGLLELGSASVKNKQSYKYSKKLMTYQNQLNVENWNRVNEYNLPINERQRLLKAGINPNFGQGSSAAQTISGPTATMEAAGADLGSMVDAGMQAYQMKKQTDNIEANTKKIQEETKGLAIDNANKQLYDYLDRGNKIKLDEATIKKLESDGIISAEQARVARSKATNEVALQNKQIDSLAIQNKLAPLKYDLDKYNVETSRLSYEETVNHNIALERLQERTVDAQVSKLKQEEREIYLRNCLNEYLIMNGYAAAQYKATTDQIASVAAANWDQVKHSSITPAGVLGNLLNSALGGDSDTFLNNMLNYFTDPSRDGKRSFMDWLEYMYKLPRRTTVKPLTPEEADKVLKQMEERRKKTGR